MRSFLGLSCLVCILLVLVPAAPGADSPADDAGTLSLKEAVDIALERNLGLRISRLSVEAARADVEQARGVFDTTLTAELAEGENRYESTTELQGTGIVSEEGTDWNVGVGRSFEPGTRLDVSWKNQRFETNLPFATLNPGYTSTLSMSVSQPLLRGRGAAVQTAGIRAAERSLAATTATVEDDAAQLVAGVRKAYWQLVFAREEMRVIQLSLTLAKTLYDETREKIDVGVLAPIEIHVPAAEVAKREEQLILGEKAIGDSEDALKLLLNAESWSSRLLPSDLPETNPELPDLEGVLEQALAHREDIRAAAENLEALRIRRVSFENNMLPNLLISGGLTANGLDGDYGGALDDLDKTGVYSWGIGLSLELPLENRAARGALLRARAEEDQASAGLDLLKQEVARAVQESVRNVRLAYKAMDAAKKTALASEKGLEAEKAKFEVGLSTTNDVLIAQENYARALSGEQSSLVAFQNALADLDRVRGGLPEIVQAGP